MIIDFFRNLKYVICAYDHSWMPLDKHCLQLSLYQNNQPHSTPMQITIFSSHFKFTSVRYFGKLVYHPFHRLFREEMTVKGR